MSGLYRGAPRKPGSTPQTSRRAFGLFMRKHYGIEHHVSGICLDGLAGFIIQELSAGGRIGIGCLGRFEMITMKTIYSPTGIGYRFKFKPSTAMTKVIKSALKSNEINRI